MSLLDRFYFQPTSKQFRWLCSCSIINMCDFQSQVSIKLG